VGVRMSNDDRAMGSDALGAFVAVSELTVPDGGRNATDTAFATRLGAVEHWPGFRGLEVWADESDPTSLMMISWWDDRASFDTYMHSDDHRASHARIPRGELRPRPHRFRRFSVIAQ
jgi:heme-degrading monooxygenase HmoA